MSSHLTVIRTLIIRDLMTRFGRNNLGFVWTILEPMILATGVMIVWSLIRAPVFHGIPIITFVITGYMPLTMWRHVTNPLIRLLRNNASLLYHRPISHADLILARLALEVLSTTAALLIVCFVVASSGVLEPLGASFTVNDPALALAAWLYTAWFFTGVGLLQCVWTETWEPAEKFIMPSQYLMLPISGCFFMVDWMPGYAQKLLLLNPMVHCFEMFRAGFFGPGVTTHYDVGYLTLWSLALTLLGAGAVYRVRDRIQIN